MNSDEKFRWFVTQPGSPFLADFYCPNHPDRIAKLISMTTDQKISVTAMARTRAVYQRGELVKDWPSLSKWYLDITDEQNRRWEQFLE